MLHQLVNMSLGCSCGSQEQSQEAGDVGGRAGEERGRERNGRDERVHASAAFIPVMRRALSNQGQAYKSGHN